MGSQENAEDHCVNPAPLRAHVVQNDKNAHRITNQQLLERCASLFPFYTLPDAHSSPDESPLKVEEAKARERRRSDQLAETLNDAKLPPSLEEGSAAELKLIRPINVGAYGTLFLASKGSMRRNASTTGESDAPSALLSSQQLSLNGFQFPPSQQQQLFAVKFVECERDGEATQRSLRREIECHQSCDFFSILRLYGGFTRRRHPGDPPDPVSNPIIAQVLEMEYANNGDLRQEIRSRVKKGNKFFSVRNALLIFVQVVLAVYYLHNQGIVHRDVKAGNVLLFSNGLVKLGDFGLSKFIPAGENVKVIGSVVGTPQYLAPEIWQRKPYGTKADIFSLGVLLYEIFSLKRPFEGEAPGEIRQRILEETPEIPPHFPSEVATIVRALLEKNPDLRPSALDLLLMPLMRLTLATLLESVVSNGMEYSFRHGRERVNSTYAETSTDKFPQMKGRPSLDCCLSFSERKKVLLDLSCVYRQLLNQAVALSDGASRLKPELSDVNGPVTADSRVLLEGVLHKESSGSWKLRYLCLQWAMLPDVNEETQKLAHPRAIELVLFLRKGSPEKLSKCMSFFIDCFVVTEGYAMDEAKYVFALLTKTGKKIWFQAACEEERQQWISFCLASIHYQHMAEEAFSPVGDSTLFQHIDSTSCFESPRALSVFAADTVPQRCRSGVESNLGKDTQIHLPPGDDTTPPPVFPPE
ncbi:putative serine/threonine protein kinase [Trypanosoma conorhini]|uniref:Putative serine/threonine protein kinase n=1 Tax=Trypanosoma conorhini TaxID=83891 RepID=A0A3R7KXD9_9TRYP|nr:putative serine/threonine protein kinase [Trypanosoma conorhini]RNF17022.1 putative serine/threonine protein kinase [Trypanosoma conorhini]